VINEGLAQPLQGAGGGRQHWSGGGRSGGTAQRYLAIVPERVFLGTAPTTVSTF